MNPVYSSSSTLMQHTAMANLQVPITDVENVQMKDKNHKINNNKRYSKHIWSKQEDSQLKDLVQFYGMHYWPKIAQFMPGRTSKQCSERWKNSDMNPDVIKGNWTLQEDHLILKMYHQKVCNWVDIMQVLEGRTRNNVRNRFYALHRAKNSYRRKDFTSTQTTVAVGNTGSNCLINSIDDNCVEGDDNTSYFSTSTNSETMSPKDGRAGVTSKLWDDDEIVASSSLSAPASKR